MIKDSRAVLAQFKKDLLNGTDNCPNRRRFDPVKKHVREYIFPKIKKEEFSKNIEEGSPILRYVTDNPLYFFNCLVKMSVEIEKLDKKTFSCFPLRSSIIPKYVHFDTLTIAKLLLPTRLNGITKNTYINNNILYRDEIWEHVFRIDKKVFNTFSNERHLKRDPLKTHVFAYNISTDGIGCSILRVRKDKYKSDKKIYIPHITKPFGYVKKEDIYIEDFSQEEKEKYKNHTIVGIDPNKGDLIYCSKIGLDKYGYSDIDTF